MFIYSLPLIFTYTDLGSPIELLLIALTLLAVLFISAPYPIPNLDSEPLKPPRLYYYFLYSLNAQLSLARVFWPFFILFNLIVFGADTAIKAGLFSVGSWSSAHFTFFFPSFIWTIAVWRSSENTDSKLWATCARLMTLAVFFEFALKIYIYQVYPRIFFNCEERILDYMICF